MHLEIAALLRHVFDEFGARGDLGGQHSTFGSIDFGCAQQPPPLIRVARALHHAVQDTLASIDLNGEEEVVLIEVVECAESMLTTAVPIVNLTWRVG
jgi:hypothetical protein